MLILASNNSPLPHQTLWGNECVEIQDRSKSLVLQLNYFNAPQLTSKGWAVVMKTLIPKQGNM